METQVQIQDFFGPFVCDGDSISAQHDQFSFTATITHDPDTRPTDFDCYSPENIKSWKKEDWYFGVMGVSASYNDFLLDDCIVAIGGVNVNFPESDNSYLNEIAKELFDEALDKAHRALSMLRQSVCQEVA
jgi:hypothetical protein